MPDKRTVVGLNGFGRFSLNLLWWWFNDHQSLYRIGFINDENLSPADMASIIRDDPYVTGFRKCKVSLIGDTLLISEPDGRTERIVLSNEHTGQVQWLGKPTIFFECSGSRSASAELCRPFLVDNTRTVIVSATCFDADETLVMGFNHEQFDPMKHKVVSYGSCTVNPGVTLLSALDGILGVKGCTIHVIHNVQQHRLDAGESQTLQRKFCTLESMGPRMLPFLEGKFAVKYTVIPWPGVSIIDFAIQFKEKPLTAEKVVGELKALIGVGGRLEGLIGMIPTDTGPEVHIGSSYSAVVVEDAIRVLGNTAHLFGYFYNEGSGSRMHELANYVTQRLQ